MDKMVVKPLIEVNGVPFGTKREKVREFFGTAIEFKKSKFSKNTTDDFGYCHIYYNTDDEFEAIEIFKGVVEIDGKTVFPNGIEALKAIAEDIVKDDSGYTSVKYSISVYAPDGIMEAVLFGINGYYA